MRTFIFIALLILAPVLASLYGFLHDQITYTISEEFFTKFRFQNYNMPEVWHPRARAGMIGIMNAWKVGIPFGIILTFVGRIHQNTRKLLFYTTYAYILTFTMSFVFSMISMYISATPDLAIAQQQMPANITDPAAFQRVVQMNNFGYVGGIIGMILGIGLQVFLYKRDKQLLLDSAE
jgi:hypothetical protein